MAGRRKPSRHRVKIHRSYAVDEVARLLGVAKGTVRRWIKGGLSAVADQKPALILGEDLVQFLASRKAPRKKCGPAECYCVKCREPRKPAGEMAEFIPLTPKTGKPSRNLPDMQAPDAQADPMRAAGLPESAFGRDNRAAGLTPTRV